MATKPKLDDPSAQYEQLAREQMKLGEDWYLESISVAIPAGIEDKIDRMSALKTPLNESIRPFVQRSKFNSAPEHI